MADLSEFDKYIVKDNGNSKTESTPDLSEFDKYAIKESPSSQQALASDKKSLLPNISSFKDTDPYAYALAKTGQDITTIPAHYFNQMGFNYPRAITEKLGYEYPSKTDNPIANTTAHIAGLAGMVQSPINKAIESIAPGKSLTSGVMRGVLTGASYSPQDPTDVGARLLQSGVGGITGGITQGVSNQFFKKQIANQELTQGAGARLQQAESTLNLLHQNDPTNYSVPVSNILPKLKVAFDDIADKKGSAGSALRTWIKIMEDKGTNGTLSPSELLEARQRLGAAASFSKEKGGALIRSEVSNEATSKLAKQATGMFSSELKSLAQKAGIDNFETDSQTVSNILKKWPELNPSTGRGDFFERGYISTALGVALHNPMIASMAYELLKVADSPEAKNKIFSLLQNNINTGAKRVARTGLIQGTQQLSNLVKGNQ